MQSLSKAAKTPVQRKLVKVTAYRSVFSGNGTQEQAEIVKADLARFTGYYSVTDANTPSEQTKFSEGRRSVFSYVLGFLRMTEAERAELEEAARLETINANQQV